MNKNTYEIKKEGEMKVPGIIYGSKKIIDAVLKDKTVSQVQNVAKLPGIIEKSIALPDAHQGYGFPIGGVAAFSMKDGIVSPGGVGYDINCGVRLLRTNLKIEDIDNCRKELLEALYKKVPSGVGRGSPFQVSKKQLDEILKNGAKWIVDQGHGVKDDYLHCEEEGYIKDANPDFVSERAKKRGIGQVGTLGAGNHFLEVQEVSEIFDEDVAKAFGLAKGQIVIMIHCGSRGLGHQVASDYIKKMEDEYDVSSFPDRELINAPLNSKLGKEYLSAMSCAANFAFANRQLIGHWVRGVFQKIIPKCEVDVLYDVCHNIAKIEEHSILELEAGSRKPEAKTRRQKVCVHRKGATRSFGAGRIEIPEVYRDVGQPVLLPGSMGTGSYVLVGTKEAEEKTFGSCAHGAGRIMSRSQAIKSLDGDKVKAEVEGQGTLVKAGSVKSLAEEAPQVYKDVDEVVDVICEEKLARKVARVKPLLVVKG